MCIAAGDTCGFGQEKTGNHEAAEMNRAILLALQPNSIPLGLAFYK